MTRTYRHRIAALFHASQTSSWNTTASVLRAPGGWLVSKEILPDASAVFVDDHLVWTEFPVDRPTNYFGRMCDSAMDAARLLGEH